MNYFQRYLAEEFAEDYHEGRISRRQALKQIASVTGSLLAASAFLAACAPAPTQPAAGTPSPDLPPSPTAEAPPTASPTARPTATELPYYGLDPAPAETPTATAPPGTAPPPASNDPVSPDDPQVQAEEVQFTSQDGAEVMGYLARPASGEGLPVVLVCHENRGLTAYIQDVTRRLGKAGYVGLAVDLLSRQGGSAQLGEGAVPGALSAIPPRQFVDDFLSGWAYLKGLPYTQPDRVGMMGFCFGGGVTWSVATHMPELRAAVPFYGPHPPIEDLARIQAAVLAIYGENDARINAAIPAVEEAMAANQKIYEKVIYPNADHAFHNNTGARFNPQAAADAWQRTIAWFQRYLA